MQGSLYPFKRLRDIRAGMIFHRYRPGFIANDDMIFIKGTGILCNRLNRPASGRPGGTLGGVGMAHGNDIGMSFMDIGV